MKEKKPAYRFSTKKAIDELANELNLRETIPHWDVMAGKSYTPGNPDDIQTYLNYYLGLNDDDKKFTLMEIILDSLAEQPTEESFIYYWNQTKPILINHYAIHEYTIDYWKDMTKANFERSDIMTPRIQNLIEHMNSHN